MTEPPRLPGTTTALALALGLWGAAALPAQPTGAFVDSVDVQVIEVDVVVTDRKGRPVKGLTREDFELQVDGRPVEISNFYESTIRIEEAAGRRKKERPVVHSEDPADSGGNDGPLTVVFYLDEPSTLPSHRTRLLRRLEAAVEPWRSLDLSFMLARFDHRLEVLVPPTADLDAILEGAASVPKGSPRAIQSGDGARRFTIRRMIDSHEFCEMTPYCQPCNDNWGELLSLAREYADNQATNTAIAVDGLADLVTTLAGVPGKKTVVHVTDGLPQRPGLSVLDYLGNELCGGLRDTAPSETMAEMVQYDESSRFNRVSAHANANRVTFYGVDAAGVRSAAPDISLDSANLAPSFRNVGLHATNAQSGLHLLAHETGGKALINANDLSILLDDMTGQLSASYSLGFVSEERGPGLIRQISVQLARGADKGRRLEYRRAYRDKSSDERLAERLLSVAYLGKTANPLAASVDFGGTTPQEAEIHELTVAVQVPVESIVTLSGNAAGGTTPGGALRVWLVAVEVEEGFRTPVRQKTITVGGATGIAAADGSYRMEVAMNLPEGEYQVAAGIRDETTGLTSLIRKPATVPSASIVPPETSTDGGSSP